MSKLKEKDFEDVKLALVSELIDNKLIKNDEYIRITFYEVRVKLDLTEEQEKEFLELARNKLINMKYKVYLENEKYSYNGMNTEVHSNELLIAIKEETK